MRRSSRAANGATAPPGLYVVMSVAKLSAGSGYEYLMRHTARGDAPDLVADALTWNYSNPDYPAGVWFGDGLVGRRRAQHSLRAEGHRGADGAVVRHRP